MEMTAVRAQEFLEHCRQGLERLWQDPTGHEWVILWAGTLALLRTVGDALKNLQQDSTADPRLQRAQDDWWQRIKAARPPSKLAF